MSIWSTTHAYSLILQSLFGLKQRTPAKTLDAVLRGEHEGLGADTKVVVLDEFHASALTYIAKKIANINSDIRLLQKTYLAALERFWRGTAPITLQQGEHAVPGIDREPRYTKLTLNNLADIAQGRAQKRRDRDDTAPNVPEDTFMEQYFLVQKETIFKGV
ncbi:unnamed protein product [Sphagnum balticum]